MDIEGLAADQIVLVINGEGGLEEKEIESRIQVLRLSENLGPAGGFARGLEYVRDNSDAPWVYLCEDDAGQLNLPAPRLADLIKRVERFEGARQEPPVGAVLSLGWDLDERTGLTSRHRAGPSASKFEEVAYGPWWATLLSRRVLDERVFPDEALFWWAEDLDYFLRVRNSGFQVLVDGAVERHPRPAGHNDHSVSPPERDEEPWCSYYMARNGFHLKRRHGTFTWTTWHLLKSARRYHLAPSKAHRAAILRGLLDGLRGRTGKNPEFVRDIGERVSSDSGSPR